MVLIFGLLATFTVSAQVPPRVIPYKGHLDQNGIPASGNQVMTFYLFKSATDKVGQALWHEVHTSVPVVAGAFAVELGGVTAIPDSVYGNANLYLGIAVGSPGVELTGRQHVASVPYALSSKSVAAGPIALVGDGAQIRGSDGVGNLHIDADKTKSDGRLYLNWSDGKGVVFGNGAQGNVASVDSAGNLSAAGIDTTGKVSADLVSANAVSAKFDINAFGSVTASSYIQGGYVIHGVVAGGTCLNGVTNFWDQQQQVYGGATCSGYNDKMNSGCPGGTAGVAQVTCPTGTTKITVSSMKNCGWGGEGAICVR